MVVQMKLAGALQGMPSSKSSEELPSVAVPRMWDAGLTVKAIASALPMQMGDVRKILAAAGRMDPRANMADFNWTDSAIETLKTMHRSGASAGEIVRALGDGPSRSAVCGKIARLKASGEIPASLGSRPGTNAIRPPKAAVAPPKPYTPPPRLTAEGPLILDDGSRVTVLTVNDRHCRFPIGDPCDEDFHFCGHRPMTGRKYCEPHCRKAYAPSGTVRHAEA